MYLMVEIRKVLEHENNLTGALGFYCNWVVHTRLDRGSASYMWDEVANNTKNGLDVISFRSLKNELAIFLRDRNLPLDLIEDKNWFLFRDNLIEILIDVPVEKVEKITTGSFFFMKDNKKVKFYFVAEDEGVSRELGDIL
jgi:hypothetical protein